MATSDNLPQPAGSGNPLLRLWRELLTAVQFLTRIPVPRYAFAPEMIFAAAKFYPIVGAVVAVGAIVVEQLLRGHLPQQVVMLGVMIYLVAVTGGFHEDGLADTCDAMGGWTRERRLEIMRDSRIGSYGTLAIVLSLLVRWQLLAAMPRENFAAYLLAAHALCRWTVVPLSLALPPARTDGLGAQLASKLSLATVIVSTLLASAIAGAALGAGAIAPVVAVCGVTALTALFYRAKLGGISGDCLGATNQLSEIAVYVCGVWM
jgi:adenosylcobinamide-GDP ribazoletransferase